MLIAEAHDLLNNWKAIMDNFKKSAEPTLLYAESDIIKRAVLTAIDKQYDRILVDDYATYQTCKTICIAAMPANTLCALNTTAIKHRCLNGSMSNGKLKRPSGAKFGFLAEAIFILTALKRCIPSMSIQGEAIRANPMLKNLLSRINLEAAEEIARQLRLRNIGGLIICDFIDMRLRKNQRRVLEKLKDCMKEDSAKCTILGMSEFGLVEMTRQRNRGSLMQTIFTSCPYCSGSGLIKSHESISIEIERALKKLMNFHEQFALKLLTHPGSGSLSQHVGQAVLAQNCSGK